METGVGTDILTIIRTIFLRGAYSVPDVVLNISYPFAHLFLQQLYGVGSSIVLFNYYGTWKSKWSCPKAMRYEVLEPGRSSLECGSGEEAAECAKTPQCRVGIALLELPLSAHLKNRGL